MSWVIDLLAQAKYSKFVINTILPVRHIKFYLKCTIEHLLQKLYDLKLNEILFIASSDKK